MVVMSGEPILGKHPPQPQWDYKPLTWTRFLRLRRWAQRVADHEGAPVYLVGSALTKRRPRDVDVSIILPHDAFVAKFGPIPPPGPENYSDPKGMAAFMQKLHVYLYAMQPYWRWMSNAIEYTRIDLKICPDSWWSDKDKLLLAAPSAGPIAQSLQPLDLTADEAEDMRAFIAHGTAYPMIPTRNVPEADERLVNWRQKYHKNITEP